MMFFVCYYNYVFIISSKGGFMAKKEVTIFRKRRFGDRKDGYKLKTIDPIARFTPYIMKKRYDALNTFADYIDVTETEKYCRNKIRNGQENFGFMYVLLAAYVRTLAEYPGINRFVSGQRIYTRNNIEVIMAVKKKFTIDGEETMIKVVFSPKDTIDEVYEKFSKVVMENQKEGDSSFDKTAGLLNKIPGFFLRFVVWVFETLDYIGKLPVFLLDVSPFHGSMIMTSMATLGIKPVYHHLYDFGNLPVFVSYGKKRDELIMSKGEIKAIKVIDFKAVTDERICDGYYFASAFKYWKKLVEHPESLENPPEVVKEDIK